MTYKILIIAITALLNIFILFGAFSEIRVNNKIKNNDYLFTLCLKTYIASFFLWLIYVACALLLNIGKPEKWFSSLLYITPIYVMISGIATYMKIKKIHKTKKTICFLKKMQALFEIMFTIVTVGLLLANLSGMSSKQVQTSMFGAILMLYTPILPIMGALKYHNS